MLDEFTGLFNFDGIIEGGGGFVLDLKAFHGVEGGDVNGDQTADNVGQLVDFVVGGAATLAVADRGHLSVMDVIEVGGRLFFEANFLVFASANPAHSSQAIVDGAANSVIGEGHEVGAEFRVEALGGFEQAEHAVADQIVEFDVFGECFPDLACDGSHIRRVLFRDVRFGHADGKGGRFAALLFLCDPGFGGLSFAYGAGRGSGRFQAGHIGDRLRAARAEFFSGALFFRRIHVDLIVFAHRWIMPLPIS